MALNKHEKRILFEHLAHAYVARPQGRTGEWFRMLRLVSEMFPSATTISIIKTARKIAQNELGFTLEDEHLYIEANEVN